MEKIPIVDNTGKKKGINNKLPKFYLINFYGTLDISLE